jgi:hypothetical protein
VRDGNSISEKQEFRLEDKINETNKCWNVINAYLRLGTTEYGHHTSQFQHLAIKDNHKKEKVFTYQLSER